MKKILLAVALGLALAATNASAQQDVTTKVTIDGTEHTITLKGDAVWAIWYSLNGAASVIHLVPKTSLRMPNGDVIELGPNGEVYRNAVRLGATNTVAEVIVLGNAFYGRAKTDATKIYQWNNATSKWDNVPSTVNKELLTPPAATGTGNASIRRAPAKPAA